MKPLTLIHDVPGWKVYSGGNGYFARLVNVTEKRDVFFQGDSARDFFILLKAFEDLTPDAAYADIFAAMWSAEFGDISEECSL